MVRENFVDQRTQAATAAVAHNGIADFAAGRKAIAYCGRRCFGRGGKLKNKTWRHPLLAMGGDSQKFGTFFKDKKFADVLRQA